MAVALAAAALLAGCSTGDDPPPDPDPDPAAAAKVGWSPCDGVTAAAVGRYAGQEMAEQTGTTDSPAARSRRWPRAGRRST